MTYLHKTNNLPWNSGITDVDLLATCWLASRIHVRINRSDKVSKDLQRRCTLSEQD